MYSFSGSLQPLLVVPSCTPDYASIPACFHGDVERTFTETSGRGYTCPCSCPCCHFSFFGELSLNSSLEHRTSQDDSSETVALRQRREEGFTLLFFSRLLRLAVLSGPAAMGCRLSLRVFLPVKQLGSECECSRDAKTVCV